MEMTQMRVYFYLFFKFENIYILYVLTVFCVENRGNDGGNGSGDGGGDGGGNGGDGLDGGSAGRGGIEFARRPGHDSDTENNNDDEHQPPLNPRPLLQQPAPQPRVDVVRGNILEAVSPLFISFSVRCSLPLFRMLTLLSMPPTAVFSTAAESLER